MNRPPVPATPRRAMTAKRRRELIERDGPLCSCGCGAPGVQVEHTIPLALGGLDHISNLTLIAVECHKAKTRADRKAIAKAKRILKREEALQSALQARFASEPSEPVNSAPARPARSRLQGRLFQKQCRPWPKRAFR